jgi:hypothetical protein
VHIYFALIALTDSTFSFLLEQWKNKLPQDCIVKTAYVDQPFEEDPCHCHFSFTNLSSEGNIVLKYQWFLGGKTPTDFVPIPEELNEVQIVTLNLRIFELGIQLFALEITVLVRPFVVCMVIHVPSISQPYYNSSPLLNIDQHRLIDLKNTKLTFIRGVHTKMVKHN